MPVTLLSVIGKAVAQADGLQRMAGGLEAQLPAIAAAAWEEWRTVGGEEEQQQALETLLQASEGDLRRAALSVAQRVAADQPAETRQSLVRYLTYVPSCIRQSFRRPLDPTGLQVIASQLPRDAEDLLLFLPVSLPSLQVGDQPLEDPAWELEEPLAVGAFGEWWQARHPEFPTMAPVTLLFCTDVPAGNVLRNQAKYLEQVTTQARHPGIVPLRQNYLHADPPCLEYEVAPGGTLAGLMRDWQRNRRSPSPTQVIQILQRLAKIIGFAHRLEPPLIHRDLKPASVIVQRGGDGALTLRIADFGTGPAAASQAVRLFLRGQAPPLAWALRGMAHGIYASPQLLRGADPDPRDDIHALGMIGWQILAADLKLSRPDTELIAALRDRGVPGGLLELLDSCIAESPDDRPRTGTALADQLGKLLQANSEDVSTTPSVNGPVELPRRVTNSIGMVLALIPPGVFRMGSTPGEAERGSDEGPQHEVAITRSFYMGIYPVTQRQYEAVTGENPAYFNGAKGGGPDFPVESISWFDAVEFCQKLSELPEEQSAGRVYRLPTEAEWEFACRAGIPMPFSSGLTLTSREANFNGNYPYGFVAKGPYLERTTRVGSYLPNAFGLFDMHGNVWEWCADYYDRTYYRRSPREDPQGPETGTQRVVRGGSCYNIGRFCRAAYRFGIAPTNRDLDVGMRVVMEIHRPQ